jgi:hypothetical protein
MTDVPAVFFEPKPIGEPATMVAIDMGISGCWWIRVFRPSTRD